MKKERKTYHTYHFIYLLWGLALLFLLTGCVYEKEQGGEHAVQNNVDTQEMKQAKTTPFGRYPELVTYTLGKMSNSDNAGMPEGDTYENNAYTRYLKKKLNIQNKNVFHGSGADYNNMVMTAIISGEIPDLMVLEDYEHLKLLVEKDMIEDLTPYYESCASKKLKEIYESYGSHCFDEVTFDGKLMAFPETLIDSGPNILWVRYDWLEKYHLKEPKTIKDVENIGKVFQKNEGTIGLPMTTEISSDYIASMNILFASKGAYIKKWILKDGIYQYGSILPEAKEGLKELRRWYQNGILDQQFLFRGDQNIEQLIIDGKCGIFFGEWWSGDHPLMKAKETNKNADWRPYLIETDQDGRTSYVRQKPIGKYVVVRKGYQYPELVIKMHSVLFGEEENEKERKEIIQYYEMNVDPTARPCCINVDYQDALKRFSDEISLAMEGRKKVEQLDSFNRSYYLICERYIREKENAKPSDWAAYATRMLACSLLREEKIKQVEHYEKGDTIWKKNILWSNLEQMEKEVYISIIIGEKPLSYFDEFVNKWKANGGDEIIKEMNEKIR